MQEDGKPHDFWDPHEYRPTPPATCELTSLMFGYFEALAIFSVKGIGVCQSDGSVWMD